MNFKKRVTMLLIICTLFYISSGMIVDQADDTHIVAVGSSSLCLYAQDSNAPKAVAEIKSQVSAEDQNQVLIRVMIVILIIWVGISFYLFTLDRKVTKLEKRLEEKNHEI